MISFEMINTSCRYGTRPQIKFFHVKYFLQQGGSLIDTAISHTNEDVIAVGMRASGTPREQAFLATKVGPEQFDDTYSAVLEHLHKFRGTTKEGYEAKVDYLDLVMLEWPHLYESSQVKPACSSTSLLEFDLASYHEM